MVLVLRIKLKPFIKIFSIVFKKALNINLTLPVLSPMLMFSLEKLGLDWNCCISFGVFFVTFCK